MRIRGIAAAALMVAVAACSEKQPTDPAVPMDVESSISGFSSLVISPSVDTVEVGKKITLRIGPSATPARDSAGSTGSGDSAPLYWGIDKPSIAWVNGGTVTGRAPGNVSVFALRGSSIGFATVVVRKARVADTSPDSTLPALGDSEKGTLYSGYSPTSPHWSHIRTLTTDFYYHWTPSERAWAGQHFDASFSGSGDAWRAANPGVTHLPYTLLWTTLTPGGSNKPLLSSTYYHDMKKWYKSHTEYRMEDAFLHSSSSRTASTRLKANIWKSDRWMINPSDPGARAYTVDRYRRLVANEEGVFIDEASSGDIISRVKGAVEYSNAEYEASYTSLLGKIKRAFGDKMIMLNTAEYTRDFDRENAKAAGAAHLELFNNPMKTKMQDRWAWVDELLSLGVSVDMSSPYSAEWGDEHSTTYPRGHYATSGERLQMWELASYYMVVGKTPDRLFFHLKEPDWSTPFKEYWFKAPEANIGHPVGARSIEQEGTDPVGQVYTIYGREFDRALVLIRAQRGWDAQSYKDGTAVDVALPSGERWLPLRADGTLGSAVTKVKIRNSEAVILIKKSRIS